MDDLFQRLYELAPLVEAQREAVGEKGVEKLEQSYNGLAEDSRRLFARWSVTLLVTVIAGAASSIAVVWFTRPPEAAEPAEIVSHIALDILVVGFVLFAVRFVAMQARAYRHVEFVANNKASALATFNLLVAGHTEPEVRAQVASVLAHAVFNSEDHIFSDSSGDNVTIVERIVQSGPRARDSP